METATTKTPHSRVLKSKIRMVNPRLNEQLDRFWNHSNFSEVFVNHLFRLYHSVKASAQLLEGALERSKFLSPTCPVAAALVVYFAEHVQEEKGHDEWLLDDMELLGIKRGNVTSQIPPTDVAALIGSQYYYMRHTHPVSLLAYLAIIEGNPPRQENLDFIESKTDIPKAALRSFYKHAELDIVHSAELWALIDSLPLTPWHSSLLGLNAMLVVEQIAVSMENLLASFPEN